EEGLRAWEVLKKEIKERGLSDCARTKVGCLRICCHGPTAVVYPEGIWYHGMTADRVPQLVQSHIVEGKPLTELTFANAPRGELPQRLEDSPPGLQGSAR